MNEITYEPPRFLTPKNVVYWSNSLKQLQGVKEGNAIQTKALIFLKKDKLRVEHKLKVPLNAEELLALLGINKYGGKKNERT